MHDEDDPCRCCHRRVCSASLSRRDTALSAASPHSARRQPAIHGAGAADLRAGGQARRAGGGQCLCPLRRRRRRSIRSSTIRSSSASSARSPEMRQRVQQSLGSGVIVRADGLIVTNNHVVAGRQRHRRGAVRQARIQGQGAAGRSAHRSGGAQDRHQGRTTADRAVSATATRCRWAIWCWRSAIPSASARP